MPTPRTRKLALAAILGSVFGVGVMAAEYFLWSVNMTFAEDSINTFSATQNYFRASQAVLNKAGLWRPGDVFIVKYIDGTIAKFKLSGRGMSCAGAHCKWVSTLPLEDPPEEVIQPTQKSSAVGIPILPGVQSIQVSNNMGYDLTGLSSIVVRVDNQFFSRQMSVFVGPMTAVVGAGGGASCRNGVCPPRALE